MISTVLWVPKGRIQFPLATSGSLFPNGHHFPHVAVLVHKLSPVHNGQKETKKEADHARLGGGSINKQGDFFMKLVFSSCKMIRSQELPSRVLKVDIEA